MHLEEVKTVPVESIFWIIFICLFLASVVAMIWIRIRQKAKLRKSAHDEKWLDEKFEKANECIQEMDPEDYGYRAVVDDTNMTITVTSVKGAQVLITPSGLFYKAPDSEVYENVVDAFFSRQAEREDR